MAAQHTCSLEKAANPPKRSRRYGHLRKTTDARNSIDPHYQQYYFGRNCTNITQHLRPLKPSDRPDLQESGGFSYPRRASSITQHIVHQGKPKRLAPAADYNYGRRYSNVTCHLRYRPPVHLGLDAESIVLPHFGKIHTDVVEPAKYKETSIMPSITSHWWKDRPNSAPLPTYPQHVGLQELEQALTERLKNFQVPEGAQTWSINKTNGGNDLLNTTGNSVRDKECHHSHKDLANSAAQSERTSHSTLSENSNKAHKHSSLTSRDADCASGSSFDKTSREKCVQQCGRVGSGVSEGSVAEKCRISTMEETTCVTSTHLKTPETARSEGSSLCTKRYNFPVKTSLQAFPATPRPHNTVRTEAESLSGIQRTLSYQTPRSECSQMSRGGKSSQLSSARSPKQNISLLASGHTKSSSSSSNHPVTDELMSKAIKSQTNSAKSSYTNRNGVNSVAHATHATSLSTIKERVSNPGSRCQDKEAKSCLHLSADALQKLGPEKLARIMKWAGELQTWKLEPNAKERKPVNREFGSAIDHSRRHTDITSIYHHW
ncbi:hypothetical protein O6H91_02G107100 [Diphasiastrum complanatum]|uniref:Uncharacterized protein n=1 Tax=Diphasiastrum complanatum TaxID=34168 RepID=A0ACC2EJE6_DIPCM|nr:hypothetical protein O6H91_02G107100 [Diphasiastrum complanatum]